MLPTHTMLWQVLGDGGLPQVSTVSHLPFSISFSGKKGMVKRHWKRGLLAMLHYMCMGVFHLPLASKSYFFILLFNCMRINPKHNYNLFIILRLHVLSSPRILNLISNTFWLHVQRSWETISNRNIFLHHKLKKMKIALNRKEMKKMIQSILAS